ncbi:hypothetical protein BC351_39095 [Paenibacillus ferrarius]|uniref:Acyl-CoA dehydrogenase n=1 Tax=Paenibacillus ferrarius TaxID=1469647 RepID=A0A1V4HB05_9BACL|nr:acyl-CoA dehydrogenase family protein [Paenibacillus ferrarius]OPH47997.1 hypothetical protein BC351_39095 [Paenibacillus ferrarius]
MSNAISDAQGIVQKKIVLSAIEASKLLEMHARDVDTSNRFPKESIEVLKRLGLMGITIPETYRGHSADLSTVIKVAKILSGSCLSTGMVWAMHMQQVSVLNDFASEPLKQRILNRIVNGEMYIVSVTSEYKKEANLFTSSAPIHRLNGEVLIERKAPTATGAAHGDAFLITMQEENEQSTSNVVLVFAEGKQVDRSTFNSWNAMGVKGTQSSGVSLSGAVPSDQLLGPEDGFEQIAMCSMIPLGHILWAACWLGAARSALHKMIHIFRNPKTRQDFNIQSDLFLERLAQVRLKMDMVEAYLSQFVIDYEQRRNRYGVKVDGFSAPSFKIALNNLKLIASRYLYEAVDELVQISGLKYGYANNEMVPLERTLRDLRSASLMVNNDRMLIANGKLSLFDKQSLDLE